jgi:glycosyltransferase involved in cell wall biosynthesis
MRVLWAKTDFLHPTTRGGQIRTLEMLRCLNRRHEVHYVCLDDSVSDEGRQRSHEYCAEAYAVHHVAPPRGSMRFRAQAAWGLASRLPVAVARYRSSGMKRRIRELLAAREFDALVCDFLFPAQNIPDISQAVLFQHNVEAAIWRRHAALANGRAARWYLSSQARRMETYERGVCRAAGHVVAVSETDEQQMRERYGVQRITHVPTGVNLDYFKPPAEIERKADLVFVGSMDWMPNIDAVLFFAEQILPRIRERLPQCKVAIVGRKPDRLVEQLAKRDSNLIVTGTVPDVRPWLWGSLVSVVPLRIGGGTRLKIFEAMAARVPVVSTTVGAEGLPITPGSHVALEDDPARFAAACVELIEQEPRRRQLAGAAWELVSTQFSWEAITRVFEEILMAAPRPGRLD